MVRGFGSGVGGGNPPDPDAGWDEIIEFAHTFDGYKRWGSFDRCAEVANAAVQRFEETGELPDDSDVIRTCLFFEARRWRHGGYEPSREDRPYIAGLLEQLHMGRPIPEVTADQLYRFICANAEEIDGEIICRASLWAELEHRGIPRGPERQRLRVSLVKELEARGLIKRIHPRSRRLLLIEPKRELLHRVRKESRENVEGRMSMGEPGAITVHEVPKHGFKHDERATRDRIAHLQSYARSRVLDNKRFVCSSGRECKASIAPGCTFKEGQLSHVGNHYDLSRNGQNLRVMVVGQEAGGKSKPHVTFRERYSIVHDRSGLKLRFDGDSEHKRRNPHMRGTTLALRTIFGLPGTDHATEFLHLGGENAHIFDCFVLVNRLLCAAHLEGTSTGKSTKTMMNNCERHFRATLEILEPTIVVIQGIKVWRWSKNVLVPIKKRGENLFQCDLAGRRVMVAAFTHPSAWGGHRWDSPDSPYFKKVVRPTLKRAVESITTS